MDWVFERFSLYDFFNLLFSGGVLLIGLYVLGYDFLSLSFKKCHSLEAGQSSC